MIACDTSVLVPALIAVHPDHEQARAAIARVDAIPAHVLCETYSVLTRLPPLLRLSARDANLAIAGLPQQVVALPAENTQALIQRCADTGISGGATYDAVVGATSRHHNARLLTRDRRARPTYESVSAEYELV